MAHRVTRLLLAVFVLCLPLLCSQHRPLVEPLETVLLRPGLGAPIGQGPSRREGFQPPQIESGQAEPTLVELSAIPRGVYDPNTRLATGRVAGRIDSPLSDEVTERLRQEALRLPATLGAATSLASIDIEPMAPTVGVGFDSLDFNDCGGGGGNVPPDPELAVGPNHIIAVVNVAFEIYNKLGNLLSGPTTFASFFNGVCNTSSVFDPNVLYDEKYDRFILGIDGGGNTYCVAATTGSDPLGSWVGYGIPTTLFNIFDYPHAGVGVDAIYMGANLFNFGGVFPEGHVWAFDKLQMYAGVAMRWVERSTGGDDSPQPVNLHGFQQATWPTTGPHYFVTSRNFNGRTFAIHSWDDPFGANIFQVVGDVDLQFHHGVPIGFPVDVPQSGSSERLQANDWRPNSAEYRNGAIWFSGVVSCNPGGGTVDCAQWAQVDPNVPAILDGGIIALSGEYRFFPDLAANDCDDMAIGYTKSSDSTFPSIWVTGRRSGDPPGTVQAETQLKSGDITYDAFDAQPHRWGDYTGMTIDPDGETFWYLGEYSRNTGNPSGRWARI